MSEHLNAAQGADAEAEEQTATAAEATSLAADGRTESAEDVAAGPQATAEADLQQAREDDDADLEREGEAGEGAAAPSPSRARERVAALEREGEVAADFLERLLDIADLDGDIDVDVDGDRAAVAIVDSEDGRVPRRLVGTDGRVLEALQELTRLAVQASTGDRSRLMLDVAGHRAGRRKAVLAEARVAIEEVKGGAEKVALEPMTAFERKVVHDEILAAGLVSESDGVEPRRYVVVYPR